MTHATYLPNLILKTITATESRHVQVMDIMGDTSRKELK